MGGRLRTRLQVSDHSLRFFYAGKCHALKVGAFNAQRGQYIG